MSRGADMFSGQNKDLETISGELDQQLQTRIAGLNTALSAAFKDADGNHRSQIVYEMIYDELQKIFEDINNDSITDNQIKNLFKDLKNNLPSYINRYYK